MSRLVNLTPHSVLTYRPVGGEPIDLPRQGTVRCVEHYFPGGEFPGGFPVTLMRYGEVIGLPEPEPDTIYVVSQLVVAALPQRADLAFPAGLVRDGDGDIIGFRLLARLAP